MSLMRWIDKALRHALAAVLPPACVACDEHLPAAEPVGFCPSCYAKLPWWDKTGVLPPELPAAVDGFAAPCLYQGVLREAILRLKFKDGTGVARILAKLAAPLVPGDAELLVPVPMHRRALRRRMYNHAALLAAAMGRLRKVPVGLRALVRVRPSDGQAQRTRAQRLKLSSADFRAEAAKVAGKHVVLVDDIYTTGATARACALALKAAGAAKVSVVTLAYTPEG